MSVTVKIWRLGLINYETGLKLQEIISKQHFNEIGLRNTILLLEHTPVYTIGIRNSNYSINEQDRLKKLGAEFHQTNRGGLITFHGPGQLVAYPILNLKDFKLTMKCYVANLEKTIINLCKNLNLKAYTCEHTGVWINDKKICAIGVHGSRYITTHGLSINCSFDILKWFEHIVPCGIEGKGVTSLSQELGRNFSVKEASTLFIKQFCNTFDCDQVDFPEDQAAYITDNISAAKSDIKANIGTKT